MRIRILITQLLVAVLVVVSGLAQALPRQIQIQKLDVPPRVPAPPGTIAALNVALRLQATATNYPEGAEARLVLQIRQDGRPICGLNPIAALTVRVSRQMQFDGSMLGRAWAACGELQPGAYTLCARFYGMEGETASEEVCTEFRVSEAAAAATYSAPVNILPADNSFELEAHFKTGIRFSWQPLEPRYDGALTYRLRIWRLEAKDAATAIRETRPVLIRDITGATETTIAGGLSPDGEQQRFVWTVQAINALGQPVGVNAGTSNPTTFSSTTYAIRLDKFSVSCSSTPGLYTFSYSLTNPNIGPAKLTAFLATSSVPAGATIASFSPPLNTGIPAGAQLTITGTLNAAPGLSNICIGAQITDLTNSFWQASKDTCIPVKPCKCDACDPKKVNIVTPTGTLSVNGNNTVSLSQSVSVTTTPLKLVKAVDAELVYFSFAPDDEDCMPCNKDSRTFGNFLTGTLGTVAGGGAGTHVLDWTFLPPKNASTATPLSATISLPPLLKCCDATLRLCVRYVITFADCTVCHKLVCYEKRLDGCSGGSPSTPNNN